MGRPVRRSARCKWWTGSSGWKTSVLTPSGSATTRSTTILALGELAAQAGDDGLPASAGFGGAVNAPLVTSVVAG